MSEEVAAAPEEQRDAAGDGLPERKSRLFLWIGLAGVAVLIAIGVWLASRPPAVQLQGEVQAEEINVATKVLARVDRLQAKEGDRVKAGQVLAVLVSPEVANGQTQAQAALETARAMQSLAEEGARKEDIASLHSSWQAAQATADLAAVTRRRSERLYTEGVIAAQRRDEARTAQVSSQRIADAARAQYEKALAGARQQNRDIAKAQVTTASAAVSTAAALEGETRLVSPVDGEISRRLVRAGEIVSPVLPAFQVIDVDHPWVTLNVQEDQYDGMKQGMVLSGTVPALKQTVRFRVQHIGPQGSFATWRATRQSRGYDVRAFEVRLEPVERVPALRPGMSVLFDWPQ